jgi:outer membrane immunogenic protein
MKRLLIIGAVAFATAAPALAADLPPPMAPPPRAPAAYIPAPPPFSWTGFYLGLNVGYGFGNSDWTAPTGTTGSFSMNGPLAGGQIGANYQIGQFVIGAEADLDWQNLRASQTTGGCLTMQASALPAALGSCATASTYLGTFRGRIGFAMDRILFYATAGGAYTTIKPSLAALSYGGGGELGWTAGAGIEYAMTDNWTVKFEYLFADFENATCNAGSCGAAAAGGNVNVSFYENLVRAGVNYKF